MARSPRSDLFDPDEVSVFHCINRCVRHCSLFGRDSRSGSNYDHRKRWLEDRIAFLAGCFGIDVLSYAILSNHFHVVLRNRPDVVASWSDTEVAHRWLRLCPLRKCEDGSPEEPTEAELNTIRNVPERLAEIRQRLSHISWMMKMITEPIARRCNAEDDCSGHFWQGRYRGVKLCDEAAVLACMAYVDLNPVRAGLACTLEASNFASVQCRVQELQEFTGVAPSTPPPADHEQDAPRDALQPASISIAASSGAALWLAPLSLDEGRAESGPQTSRGATRCSDKGVLPMTLEDYLQLVDWTGRQRIANKPGAIPEHLAPILERLGIGSSANWLELSTNFDHLFHRVAGRPESIHRQRTRRGHRPFRGAKRQLFVTVGAGA